MREPDKITVLDLEKTKEDAWRLARIILEVFLEPNSTEFDLQVMLSACNIIRASILNKMKDDSVWLIYDPTTILEELHEFIEQGKHWGIGLPAENHGDG